MSVERKLAGMQSLGKEKLHASLQNVFIGKGKVEPSEHLD